MIISIIIQNGRQRAAAAKLEQPSTTPEPEPEQEPHTTQDDDGAGDKTASVEDQLKLLKKLKVELLEAQAQELKLEAENAQLARQVRQGVDDGYGTESSRSSSSGSVRQRRSRGSHTAGQRAIAYRDTGSDDE